MPSLIDAVSTRFATDFHIIQAVQKGVGINPGASFAGSTPGVVSLEAGFKEAHISIQAERWDGRPADTGGWEDLDDIPFEEVQTAGKLILQGFDNGTVGLDLSGFGSGRVQVLARGRHRFEPGSPIGFQTVEPEEWLLRFYPIEGSPDPMAGGPRRIAGGGGLSRPSTSTSPWLAAVRGFRSTGWSSVLSSQGFHLAYMTLAMVTAPLSRQELAQQMAKRMPPWELGGSDAESLPLPAPVGRGASVDLLASLTGRDAVNTIGDSIDALVDLGLLLTEMRDGARVHIPNPAPVPAWVRLGLSGEQLVKARARYIEGDHGGIATTISFAVAWCRERGLTATPRAMALRWGTSVDDLVGGLRLLGGSGRVRADQQLGFDTELDPDQAITLWKP